MKDIESRQLYELSREDAQEVLEAFIREGREAMTMWGSETKFALDYSSRSVCQLFEYGVHQMRAEVGSETIDERAYGNFRSVWLVRTGFYFGESLVRSFQELRWSLGELGTAYQNHPVVSGFPNGTEAAVMSVSKNVTFSVLSGASASDRIVRTVEHWFASAA